MKTILVLSLIIVGGIMQRVDADVVYVEKDRVGIQVGSIIVFEKKGSYSIVKILDAKKGKKRGEWKIEYEYSNFFDNLSVVHGFGTAENNEPTEIFRTIKGDSHINAGGFVYYSCFTNDFKTIWVYFYSTNNRMDSDVRFGIQFENDLKRVNVKSDSIYWVKCDLNRKKRIIKKPAVR